MRRRPLPTRPTQTAPSQARRSWKALTARPVWSQNLDPPRSATLDSMLVTLATAIIPLDGIALPEIRAWAQLTALFSPSHYHNPHGNASLGDRDSGGLPLAFPLCDMNLANRRNASRRRGQLLPSYAVALRVGGRISVSSLASWRRRHELYALIWANLWREGPIASNRGCGRWQFA